MADFEVMERAEWRKYELAFGRLEIGDAVLPPAEVARLRATLGTIKVTITRGHKFLARQQFDRERLVRPAQKTSSSREVIKLNGVTHFIRTLATASVKDRRELPPPCTFRALDSGKGKVASFTFRCRSRKSLFIRNIVDSSQYVRMKKAEETREARKAEQRRQREAARDRKAQGTRWASAIKKEVVEPSPAKRKLSEIATFDEADESTPSKRTKSVDDQPPPYSVAEGHPSGTPKSVEEQRLELRLEEFRLERRLLELRSSA
ncbi:hypothetical protein LTR85_009526 [Meristemomyces frigidus]|nr:hypothetical protein LTR85_009526 [Meristemomyces frigidus]